VFACYESRAIPEFYRSICVGDCSLYIARITVYMLIYIQLIQIKIIVIYRNVSSCRQVQEF